MADNYSQFCEALVLGPDPKGEKVAWIRSVLECTQHALLEHVTDPPDGFLEEELEKRFGIEHILAELGDTLDCWPDFGWHFNEEEDTLFLEADEHFDLDHVLFFVQQYLKKFEPKGVFRMTWSDTCSKLRVSEFGGGWAVVTAKAYVAQSTGSAAEETAEEMAKELGGHVQGAASWPRREGDPSLFLDEVNGSYLDRIKASYIQANQLEGETLGDTRMRMTGDKCLNGYKLFELIDQVHACECDQTAFPGIAFPIGVDGNFDRAWVQRCSDCELFESDDHAAFFVARKLGLEVAYAKFDPTYSARPFLKGITFEQAQDIEKKLRK